jgi:hypothetical protein
MNRLPTSATRRSGGLVLVHPGAEVPAGGICALFTGPRNPRIKTGSITVEVVFES